MDIWKKIQRYRMEVVSVTYGIAFAGGIATGLYASNLLEVVGAGIVLAIILGVGIGLYDQNAGSARGEI